MKKLFFHFKIILKSYLIKKKDVLIYVGLHKGQSFDSLFRQYKLCYGFEADPELFYELKKKYHRYPNVRLINAAVTFNDGEIDFNISSNKGESSSIGRFDEGWSKERPEQIYMEKTIRVPCINLQNFLRAEGIHYIDDYISDIQGMDLEVLKTLQPFIQNKKIGAITCEVTKNKHRNIYYDLPDNSEKGFDDLLKDNYAISAKGWGILKDGDMRGTPEAWWEMDCKWRLK